MATIEITDAVTRIDQKHLPMNTKTPLLLLLMSVMTYSVQAQTEKGKWLIGATTNNLSLAASKGTMGLSLQVSPNVGYFVANNLAVGVRLGFSYSNSRTNGQSESRSTGIAATVFGRYYIPISSKIKIPIDIEAGYAYGTGYSGRYNFVSKSIIGGISTGIAWFPSKNLSIDLLAGYRFQEYLDGGRLNHQGRFNAQIGFNLFLDGKQGKD